MKTTLSVAVARHSTKALLRLRDMGRARAITVAFGSALALRVVFGAVPADATTLPVLAPGDPISGVITLDPSTPLSSFSRPPLTFDWRDPGSMAVTLGGQIFAEPLVIAARASPSGPLANPDIRPHRYHQWRGTAAFSNDPTHSGQLRFNLHFPTGYTPAPTPTP
jgi:hypothetical protein